MGHLPVSTSGRAPLVFIVLAGGADVAGLVSLGLGNVHLQELSIASAVEGAMLCPP